MKTDRYRHRKLAEDIQPSLYTHGSTSLLSRPAVGICGARNASDQKVEHARDFGYVAAQMGFVVVSGHARGVDTAAHMGALEGGGGTVAVLAEGLRDFKPRQALRALATADNFLAVTSYEETARWTVWRAMQRNQVIVALSQALFIIEARETGGTWHAGLECLRQGKPLCVLDYEGEHQPKGNRALIGKSAVRVRSIDDVKAILSRLKAGDTLEAQQAMLEI